MIWSAVLLPSRSRSQQWFKLYWMFTVQYFLSFFLNHSLCNQIGCVEVLVIIARTKWAYTDFANTRCTILLPATLFLSCVFMTLPVVLSTKTPEHTKGSIFRFIWSLSRSEYCLCMHHLQPRNLVHLFSSTSEFWCERYLDFIYQSKALTYTTFI